MTADYPRAAAWNKNEHFTLVRSGASTVGMHEGQHTMADFAEFRLAFPVYIIPDDCFYARMRGLV